VRASLFAARRDPSAVPAQVPSEDGGAREPRVTPHPSPSNPGGTLPHRAAQPALVFAGASRASSPSSGTATVRCPVCLERIAAGVATCPECGEPTVAAPASTGHMPSGAPSIPDELPGQSVLALHWRPIVTVGAITALVCTGIALRHLAPGRFTPPPRSAPRAAAAAPAAPACSAACWSGEACQAGRCVWQPPNDVSHVAARAEATVSGPTPLPRDASDAIPLDAERFAVSLLTGLQVHNARTGNVLGLLTDAPQSMRLYRVGPVVYATGPQRIYVIDAASTRLLKTVEMGTPVGEVTVGASGRRALASLPGAHAVAVLATEYHAEIDRIQFGDDPVGPVRADDTGKRALTTNGQVPLPGFPNPPGGAVYAFDPSRLASAQDRVRASMVGNPVSVLMTPDGETSYVVLRAEDALAPLTWLPSGAVRQEARIPTCHEPEQIELVRRGRLGVVRCNEGRAVEVFDLVKRELVVHVPFNARVTDLAVSPDGKQAIVALPADGAGFVGLLDLETDAVKVLPVSAEPTRVRLSPDGSMALVVSDRAKVAWVIR
jgi:DNA-binding beta-propeller fold protein YncE